MIDVIKLLRIPNTYNGREYTIRWYDGGSYATLQLADVLDGEYMIKEIVTNNTNSNIILNVEPRQLDIAFRSKEHLARMNKDFLDNLPAWQ